MPASKDSDLDQKPLSSGLTRRQFIPLLGAAAALATVAPRSVAAAKPGNLGFPGSFPVYRILANGAIGPMTDIFLGAGNGTGPNPERQEAPHAHQILTDLDGHHVFGVDLGADKVNVLNLNPGTGVLTANTVPFAPVASGSGPRHMAFHPDRR